jgi:branched-subunit amino acid permease
MFAVAAWLYLARTRPLDKTGKIVPWILLALLYLLYLMNLFSPEPPPSTKIIAWSAFGMWLFVGLGYWTDRHREKIG